MSVLFVVVLMALLGGCNSRAEGGEDLDPSIARSANVDTFDFPLYRRELAIHPGYVSPKGIKTECVGRQLIDVPGDMEWALWKYDPQQPQFSPVAFEKELIVMNEVVQGMSFFVRATYRVERSVFDAYVEEEKAVDEIAVRNAKEQLEQDKRLLGKSRDHFDAETIEKWESGIRDFEATINMVRSFDVGVPDSYGAIDTGGSRIYLYRDGRVYRFTGYGGDTAAERADSAVRLKAIATQRFRPRATYEIPTDSGFCIPHGFIADAPDESHYYRLQATFREKAMPNVLYTIKLERNLPNDYPARPGVGATRLEFGRFANFLTLDPRLIVQGLLNGRQERKLAKQSETFRFGAYPGAFSGKVGDGPAKGEKGQAYQLDAGMVGAPDDDALPTLSLRVAGFPPSTHPSLAKRTPTVEVSLAKMAAIGRSIRWRPVAGEPLPDGVSKVPTPEPESPEPEVKPEPSAE